MKTRYKINEMTCGGCQAKVTEALRSITPKVAVSLYPAEAVIESDQKISLEELQHALSHKGPYTIQEITEKDRKSTRLNSSHVRISYAVFCLKKKKKKN